ncbi:DUF4007 family protein [Metabacillus arenae]|uniref:DUF4007 family protein n=1 Tax=Metabacillus arenae TaxID=2771434 RepID=A0A926NDM8_9BACI|nr:DUF4007 family protein [Metabacillus arenae]MBD1381554.1 DUF4007 family protein [Metabacillus arenae]
MAYGQHQSFYLRDRWLNKAIKHLIEDERFFYDKEAFEKIGLGKNMVQSLRFWVVATRVVEEKFNNDRKKIHLITPLGNIIYKYDKFIQFRDTASIIHYNLAKEIEPATTWYWFFNKLNEITIKKENLNKSLNDWVVFNEDKKISIRSLSRDVDCLIKLYTAGQSILDPEENIQSPITKINLLKENKGNIIKNSPSIDDVGDTALLYTLIKYAEDQGIDNVSVEEIATKKGLWGKIFNLNRATIVNALEKFTNQPKYSIKFTRTNNLDTVRLPEISSLEFLEFEYKRKVETLV